MRYAALYILATLPTKSAIHSDMKVEEDYNTAFDSFELEEKSLSKEIVTRGKVVVIYISL